MLLLSLKVNAKIRIRISTLTSSPYTIKRYSYDVSNSFFFVSEIKRTGQSAQTVLAVFLLGQKEDLLIRKSVDVALLHFSIA